MPATRELGAVDFNHAAELLRPAVMSMAESFPVDWRTASFEIAVERTAAGPEVWLRSYEIHGDDYEEAGKTCG